MHKTMQLELFPDSIDQIHLLDTASTFVDNMKLPLHRWFRYSAGFSADWVKKVIDEFSRTEDVVLFDPFAGSGTTILAGQEFGVTSIGVEAHPFVIRIARAKMQWQIDTQQFVQFARNLLVKAKECNGVVEGYPDLIRRCFPDNVLCDLDALRQAWTQTSDRSPVSELSWLALTSILRISSPVGTSQIELIQPKKSKQNFVQPFEAFSAQIRLMEKDMLFFQKKAKYKQAVIYHDDARYCREVEDQSVNLVITSPPYLNNFDYADVTRLEMTFWGEIQGWGDLQDKVRRHLVRSCSQHMSAQKDSLEEIFKDERLRPIIPELEKVCKELAEERLLHGGKKNYHLMVAAYFSDLAKIWNTLRRVCKSGSRVCFVIGDSAPYGVYIPVHTWLGELAISGGFKSFYFEKTRDRNVKWRNRKHKVPLCEGLLWVEG